MARVVHDTLHADKADTGDAEVTHKLLGMVRAEVRIFH